MKMSESLLNTWIYLDKLNFLMFTQKYLELFKISLFFAWYKSLGSSRCIHSMKRGGVILYKEQLVSVLCEFVLSVLLYFYFFPGEGNHANCLLLHFFFTYFFTCKGSIYLYFKYQGCFYWCSKTLEAFLSVPEEKQVPAIFMALTVKIREAILKRILKN